MKETTHIGEKIRIQLFKEERSIIWLAEKLNYERDNIYRLMKRNSLNTHLLLRISIILKHDFFMYYSKHLPDCIISIFFDTMKESIHIGNEIRKLLFKEKKSIIWFARKLHYERDNVYKLLKRPSLCTHLLFRISKILKHDFFAYYSKYLQDRYSLKCSCSIIGRVENLPLKS